VCSNTLTLNLTELLSDMDHPQVRCCVDMTMRNIRQKMASLHLTLHCYLNTCEHFVTTESPWGEVFAPSLLHSNS